MRGVEAVIAIYNVSWFRFFLSLGGKGRHTAQQVTLQALSQAKVRRPQGVVELAEAAAIVTALDVTLDALEQGLNALQTSVKSGEIALRGQVLLQLRVTRLGLGGLASQFLKDIAGGLVGKLKAATEINKLSSNAGIEDLVAGGGNGRKVGRGYLVLNRLLGSLVLIYRSTLAGS